MIKSMALESDGLSSNPASSLPTCGQVLDLSASASSAVNERPKIYITRALCRLSGTSRHSTCHMVTVRPGLALSLLFRCPGVQVPRWEAQRLLCLGSLKDSGNRKTQESALLGRACG